MRNGSRQLVTKPLAQRLKEKSLACCHPHKVFGPLSRGFCVAIDSPVCEPLVDVMDAYLTDPGSLDMVVWLSG